MLFTGAMLIDGGGDVVPTSSASVDTNSLAGILAASQFGSSTPWAQAAEKYSGLNIDTSSLIKSDTSTANTGTITQVQDDINPLSDPINYRDVANFDASLANIAKVGAAMRDAGLNTAGHVAKYTQPISVPSIDNGQPLNADDPRNAKAFREKYGRYPSKADFQAFQGKSVSDIGKPTTTLPEHQNWMWLPTTGWRAVWEAGYGPGAFGTSLQNISGNNNINQDTQGSVVYAAASDLVTTGNSITAVASGNGGAASIESATSFVNNDPIVANVTDSLPSPVYALDSPENLYIDPNSFNPIILNEYVYIGGSATPSAFSSTVYSVDLKFNPVPGAVKYNYRISATI